MHPRFCGEGEDAKLGFYFERRATPDGAETHITTGSSGVNLINGMIKSIVALADTGNDIIVDEVLFGDRYLKVYVEALKNHGLVPNLVVISI